MPGPERQLIVRDLVQANRWAEHNLERALAYVKAQGRELSLEVIANTAASTTLSTCFSGTGGGELVAHGGALCIQHFLRAQQGERGDDLADLSCKTLWACDVDTECQRELQLLPHPPTCIFRDVTLCMNRAASAQLHLHGGTMRYNDLQKVMKHPKLVGAVMQRGACIMHPDQECRIEKADVHIAGTECVVWSSQGSRQGCIGKKVTPWVAWVAMRRATREPVIFRENVAVFPLELLEQELGDLYVVVPSMSAIVCPSRFGQPCARSRRLTIMWLKEYVSVGAREGLILGSSFDSFCKSAERRCDITWGSYFRADEDEINEEYL
eukprot:9495740-Pyramimonas_sp.AAC.1